MLQFLLTQRSAYNNAMMRVKSKDLLGALRDGFYLGIIDIKTCQL